MVSSAIILVDDAAEVFNVIHIVDVVDGDVWLNAAVDILAPLVDQPCTAGAVAVADARCVGSHHHTAGAAAGMFADDETTQILQ